MLTSSRSWQRQPRRDAIKHLQGLRSRSSLPPIVLVLIVGPKLFIEPGTKAFFRAFERERPRIVNNFAASASSGYELSSSSEKIKRTRLSNLAMVVGPGTESSAE